MVSLATSLPHLSGSIPSFSIDALIVGAVALVFVYSVVAGHAALVRESISIYVGLVLATTFGGPLYQYAHQSAGHGFPVNQMEIQLALLIIPIVLLQFVRHHHGHTPHHNIVVTMILALCAAMLLVSSIIAQLDPLTLEHVTDQSNLAAWINDLRLVWLAAVPAAIAASAIIKPRRHH